MPYKAFFDGPYNYQNKFDFYEQGGSPNLLKKFIETVEEQKEEIKEINIAWYLYNNPILHNYLKKLSESGIVINVITIPLEGYDHTKPKTLKDLDSGVIGKSAKTKYSVAREIFKEMHSSKNYPNFNLYFFPHLYVRSKYVNKFSRGTLPYSLHVKSAYIKKKDGFLLFISSSNLAVRDLVKHESMICIEDEKQYEDNFDAFFKDLISKSINIKSYTRDLNTSSNTYECIDFKKTKHSFITAPFYYNSANELETTLIELINKAKHRIIICAQHLAAFNYQFDANFHSTNNESKIRQGILGAVINKANQDVKVCCLSQTFVPSKHEKDKFANKRFRTPSNSRFFKQFYEQLSQTTNASYFVNESIHSKFIIIDSTLIYCTYNYTPTQFIYLDKVKIDEFVNMPDLRYEGIHCEVGMHVIVEDESILKLFEENIEMIKGTLETIQVR